MTEKPHCKDSIRREMSSCDFSIWSCIGGRQESSTLSTAYSWLLTNDSLPFKEKMGESSA